MRKTSQQIARLRLCEAMLLSGHTIKTLARAAALSVSAVEKFRTGKLRPSKKAGGRIETILGKRIFCSPSEWRECQGREDFPSAS